MSSDLPRLRLGAALGALLLALGAPTPAAPSAPVPAVRGKVFLTMEEALELAFPGCEVERDKQFLSKAERARAEELAGCELESSIAYVYSATREGKPIGTAYFDAHRVRTKRETVMIVVAPDATIQRLEILAFAEPLDYLPGGGWYAQYLGKRLDDDLSLKRGIRGITGATLTAQATTRAARRVLAVHQVLGER